MSLKTLTLLGALAASLSLSAAAAPLTVHVKGVEARGGVFYVGVQTEDQFMQDGGVDGSRVEEISAGTHSYTYDLPAGEYSVSVWHDEDGDGVFDMGEDGMPKDGWSMYKAEDLRGMPTFDAVKTTLDASGQDITLNMMYSD